MHKQDTEFDERSISSGFFPLQPQGQQTWALPFMVTLSPWEMMEPTTKQEYKTRFWSIKQVSLVLIERTKINIPTDKAICSAYSTNQAIAALLPLGAFPSSSSSRIPASSFLNIRCIFGEVAPSVPCLLMKDRSSSCLHPHLQIHPYLQPHHKLYLHKNLTQKRGSQKKWDASKNLLQLILFEGKLISINL